MNDSRDPGDGSDPRLEEALRARAERGTPRGPGAVWARATARSTAAPPRRGIRAWVPVGAAAVVVLLVSVGVRVAGGDGQEDPGPRATTTTPSPSGAAAPSPASPSPTTPVERSTTYLACAREHGVSLDYAEVQRSRTPDWVKTLVEVPADVHRPCLQAVGGRDPLASSSGVPVALGACESVDRTPPIEWRPAPSQSYPTSVVVDQRLAVPQGSGALVLPLSDEVTEVPSGVVVECWNGQAWQPAYVATGLGGSEAAAVEMEEEVRPDGERVDVGGGPLELPVPTAAPVTDYRVRAEADLCRADGECRRAPLEVAFSVTRP